MAIGITLAELVYDLRAETGASTNAAQGTNALPMLKRTLKKVQEKLYQDFLWTHLRDNVDENLQVNERFYSYDPRINFTRIFGVYAKANDFWTPVSYGIGPEQYNQFDSEQSDNWSLPLRWRNKPVGQFEVWPVPSVENITLRFDCVLALPPFIADTDKCSIDSELLIMFAAAQILKRLKSADWEDKQADAMTSYRNIRASSVKTDPIKYGECNNQNSILNPFYRPDDWTIVVHP